MVQNVPMWCEACSHMVRELSAYGPKRLHHWCRHFAGDAELVQAVQEDMFANGKVRYEG